MSGTYSVKNGIVTITSAYGSKSAHVGTSKPASLAFILLRELFDDARTGIPSRARAGKPPTRA
jgi:hypothetical protein